MSVFRKRIIRSSANTSEEESSEDYFRIKEVSSQIDELLHVYYGHDTSFMPYTHDDIAMIDPVDGSIKRSYTYNPKVAELLIDELMSTINEQYWEQYTLPEDFFEKYNDDIKKFYRSFLYLAIRMATIKTPSQKPEGYHAPIGSGTFRDLDTLIHAFVIPYSESEFHREFEIGIPNPKLPGIFFDIQDICRGLDMESCFLHKAASAEEQESARKADEIEQMETARYISSFQGFELNQYLTSEEYMQESIEYLKQKENERLKKLLEKFPEPDKFIENACTFRNLLFRYNNHETEYYLDNAIKLFLLRNGHSVLSDRKSYQSAHLEIGLAMNKLKSI